MGQEKLRANHYGIQNRSLTLQLQVFESFLLEMDWKTQRLKEHGARSRRLLETVGIRHSEARICANQ